MRIIKPVYIFFECFPLLLHSSKNHCTCFWSLSKFCIMQDITDVQVICPREIQTDFFTSPRKEQTPSFSDITLHVIFSCFQTSLLALIFNVLTKNVGDLSPHKLYLQPLIYSYVINVIEHKQNMFRFFAFQISQVVLLFI